MVERMSLCIFFDLKQWITINYLTVCVTCLRQLDDKPLKMGPEAIYYPLESKPS